MPPNVNTDPAELAKFEPIASRWWDPESEFKPLHQINPLRLSYVEECLGNLVERRIVDVGCGGGLLSEAMACRGAKVLGIDLAERSLEVARLHALEKHTEIDYRLIGVEELAENRPHEFDAVTCMELLEHVPNPALTVNACARLLRPGGAAIFSTINRNPKAYLLAVIGAEYVLQLLPCGTHDYRKFIRPSELATWAREPGLSLQNLRGLGYNPITRHYRLVQDVSVNYLAHFTYEQ